MVWADEEEEMGLGRGRDRAANAATVRESVQRHPWAGKHKNPGARNHFPHRLAVYITGLEECRCGTTFNSQHQLEHVLRVDFTSL